MMAFLDISLIVANLKYFSLNADSFDFCIRFRCLTRLPISTQLRSLSTYKFICKYYYLSDW